MKPVKMWAVVGPDGNHVSPMKRGENQAVLAAADILDMPSPDSFYHPWKDMKQLGFRVARFQLIEMPDTTEAESEGDHV